jgi:hypothetical protein
MDIVTIKYPENGCEPPDERHTITLDICKENVVNFGALLELAFKMDDKLSNHGEGNNLDVEMISAIALYKEIESYFEGSAYKSERSL